MPLPASEPSTGDNLFRRMVAQAEGVLGQVRTARNACAAGPVTIEHLAALHGMLRRGRAWLLGIRDNANLDARAKEIMGPSFSVPTEIDALITRLDAVTSWIASNAPSQGGRYQGWDLVNGDLVRTTMTAAQLAPLVTLLDDLIAQFAA